MDNDTLRTLAAIGVPTVLGLVWLLRLEGRLNTHEAVCAERYKNLINAVNHIKDHIVGDSV